MSMPTYPPYKIVGHQRGRPCPKCEKHTFCEDCGVCESCGFSVSEPAPEDKSS